MNDLKEIQLEYIYVTIPAEYICIYHRILGMLADYGEDMLKNCKASCKDKHIDAIDCFNMFNSAIAAKKLGKDKLANVLIKYIDAKLNQLYNKENNTSQFIYPIDFEGHLKTVVTCGEHPIFKVDTETGHLIEKWYDKVEHEKEFLIDNLKHLKVEK